MDALAWSVVAGVRYVCNMTLRPLRSCAPLRLPLHLLRAARVVEPPDSGAITRSLGWLGFAFEPLSGLGVGQVALRRILANSLPNYVVS